MGMSFYNGDLDQDSDEEYFYTRYRPLPNIEELISEAEEVVANLPVAARQALEAPIADMEAAIQSYQNFTMGATQLHAMVCDVLATIYLHQA